MKNSNRQMLILVDKNDTFTGEYADKGECHFGEGLHHRAFVVLLKNSKGEVLLQLRKHVRWDDYWDLTAISHVLHLSDHDETYEEAAHRALRDEMAITDVKLEKVGGFNYFAKYHGQCENEYCAVFVGKYDGEYVPNNSLVYETQWIKKEDFFSDIAKHPDEYTPWCILAAKMLRKKLKSKLKNTSKKKF